MSKDLISDQRKDNKIKSSANNINEENQHSEVSSLSPPVFQLSASNSIKTNSSNNIHSEDEASEQKYNESVFTTPSAPPSNNIQFKSDNAQNINIISKSNHPKNINAKAFTQGNNIHFAPNQFKPNTSEGQKLIGHEVAHVIQQKNKLVSSKKSLNGYNINDDPALENEADQKGKNLVSNGNLPFQFNYTNADVNNLPIQRHPNHEGENESDHEEIDENKQNSDDNARDQHAPHGREPSLVDIIELALFNLRSVWGPQSLVPPIFSNQRGYGGFEATYNRPAKLLQVIVRGKTQFINGLADSGTSVNANQEDLDQLANILNIIGDTTLNGNILGCYTWTDDAKETAKEQFKQRLGEAIGIWENTGLEFYINKPGWEEITANLNVSLEVEEEGTLGDTNSRESNGQHQQIQIYKTPDESEIGMVRSSVRRAIQTFENDNAMSIGQVDNYDVRAYVDGDTDSSGYADDNPYNGSMTLSSNDLSNAQGNSDYNMLSTRVFFDHNVDTLSSGYENRLKSFIRRFNGNGDSNESNNAIKLIGHSSKSGSDDYNKELAQRRINNVKTILSGENISNFENRVIEDNKGESENSSNQDNNEAYYRSVEIKIGSGERQNTVAHEFGHVFGLADEYEEGGRSAGDASGHDQLSRDMGTGRALVENNDGIISMGNEVRAQHYSPFIWALRELTNKQWLVRNRS